MGSSDGIWYVYTHSTEHSLGIGTSSHGLTVLNIPQADQRSLQEGTQLRIFANGEDRAYLVRITGHHQDRMNWPTIEIVEELNRHDEPERG